MKTITLQVEDCDDIIIDELKDAYRLNNRFDKVDDLSNDVLEHITGSVATLQSVGFTGYLREPDYDLLKAIRTVLAYYMLHEDYEEWVEMNPMLIE